MKLGVISLLVFVMGLFSIMSFASAALDLTINADFSNYNEDLILQAVSGATTSFDYAYDAQIPSNPNPDGYMEFYSLVGGKKLAIDSWDGSTGRNLVLGIDTSSGIIDDLTLSWSFSSSSYNAVLKYCGTDSGCASPVQTKDMESDSSLTVSGMNTASTHYFSLVISLQATPVVPSDGGTSGGGGGGGGGAAGPTVYSLTDSQLAAGVEKSLKVPDVVVFNLEKKIYNLTLTSFDNVNAVVYLLPSDKRYTIGIGQSILLDVNGDGVNDVAVGYSNYSNYSARIELKKSSNGFIADNVEKITQTIDETVTKFKLDPVFRMKILTSIFSVLIIIVALIWLLIKLVFKKSNSISN